MTENWPADEKTSVPPHVDPNVANAARVYDYLLGGRTNFGVDRRAAVAAGAAVGGIEVARSSVRSNRVFLGQVVRYLAGEAGVCQFLDIGTGIPNDDNVQAVALGVAPDARVVSVDNDPIVLAHAHHLLPETEGGPTSYIHCDLRQPEVVLERAAETLDLAKPVAVLFIAVLHHVPDSDDPYGIVGELMAGVSPGSYLALSHLTDDMQSEEMAALVRSVPASARYGFVARSRAEIGRFFEGMELVEPGIVPIDRWRPDQWSITPEGRFHYGAVGRKP